jgi:hypothetical protein
VALAPERDVPNRDLVLDVRFREAAVQTFAGASADGRRSFAAIVPSNGFGAKAEGPRRTVILLDRSGSMQGAPIAQARKAIEACLATLTEKDWFGLVAFDDQVENMPGLLVTGTRENRASARVFLSQVDARGGTELARGFLRAAEMLEGGGDVLVLTDGQVAGTEQILAQARGAGIRLSCLGIGSASQDRFLALLARETGGVIRFVTPRERVDLAAVELFASIGQPVASRLKVSGNVDPAPPKFVSAGSPILLFGETEEDPGTVELTWEGGRLQLTLPPGNGEIGQTIRLLQGSRLITDWESRYPSEEALAPPEKRKQSRVGARLLALSQAYGLASREMSLVVVVKRAGDRPGELPETRVVPVGMPQDVSFGAYFPGRAPGAMPQMAVAAPTALFSRKAAQGGGVRGMLARVLAPKEAADDSIADPLMDLASELEPDGGMPGESASARAARSVAAVLAFVTEGHTLTVGAFRSHVARLVDFLKTAGGVSDRERALIDRAIEVAARGSAPRGDWLALARTPGARWAKIEGALKASGR